jgi:hypothetical protein
VVGKGVLVLVFRNESCGNINGGASQEGRGGREGVEAFFFITFINNDFIAVFQPRSIRKKKRASKREKDAEILTLTHIRFLRKRA